MSEHITQAEFAQRQGWGKSYVSKLKAAGRLVMTEDGRVDVDASRARIAETADPNRDDVAARHAAARANTQSPPPTVDERITGGYQAARAINERYKALQAKLDYERALGEVLPRAAVVKVMTDAATTINTAIENLLDRLPSQVTGVPDAEVVRARCRSEFEQLQYTVARLFGEAAEKARG